MQDTPETTKTFATLRIWGEDFDPTLVTNALHTQPSKQYKAGEQLGKRGRVRANSGWQLTTEHTVTSPDIADHITWLLDQLEPVAEAFADIRRDHAVQADIFCFWETANMNDDMTLSVSLMQRLGALELELGLDIYCA